MVAQCSSSSIRFGANEVKVTKNLIGLLVVSFDLSVIFIFWCSMLALTKMQEVTENEINAERVTPVDYTVVISQDAHSESVEDLPGVYFAWAEHILQTESE